MFSADFKMPVDMEDRRGIFWIHIQLLLGQTPPTSFGWFYWDERVTNELNYVFSPIFSENRMVRPPRLHNWRSALAHQQAQITHNSGHMDDKKTLSGRWSEDGQVSCDPALQTAFTYMLVSYCCLISHTNVVG